MNRISILGFLWLSIIAQDLYAQNPTGTMLPQLDPLDIEIRGDFKLKYASLNRQPILGFSTNQRIYALDPNRLPYMETEEEVRTSLPIPVLSRPVAPRRLRILSPKNRLLHSYGSYGSFNSIESGTTLHAPISDNASILSSVYYDYSEGHLSDLGSYDNLIIHTGLFANTSPKGQWYISGSAKKGTNDTNNTDVDKSYRGVGLATNYQYILNGLNHVEFALQLDANQIDSNVAKRNNQDVFLQSRVSYQKTGKKIGDILLTTVELASSQSRNTSQASSSRTTVYINPNYERQLNYIARLRVGSLLFVDQSDESNIGLYPEIGLEWFQIPGLIVSTNLSGDVVHHKPSDFHFINKFSNLDIEAKSERKWVADAKLIYDIKNLVEFSAALSYQQSKDLPYFQTKPLETEGALYAVSYAPEATMIKATVGANISLIPDIALLNAQAYYQENTMDDNVFIPFTEKMGATVESQFRFFDRFYMRAWYQYIGDRTTDIKERELEGFSLVNAESEIMLTSNVGFYVKGLNLLNKKYIWWKDYEERSLQLYGGVKLRF